MSNVNFLFSDLKVSGKFAIFNLAISTDIGLLYILGFRISSGFILPPSTKTTRGGFITTFHLDRIAAEKLYDAIVDQDWGVTLRPQEEAISELILTPTKFALHYGKEII